MRFCFWRWLQNHTRTTFFFRSSFSAIAAIFSELGLKGFLCVNGIWMMRNKLTSVELWNRLLNFVSRALQSTFVSVSFRCHYTRLLLFLLLPHFRPVLAMPEHRPYLKRNIPLGSQHNIMSNKERERETCTDSPVSQKQKICFKSHTVSCQGQKSISGFSNIRSSATLKSWHVLIEQAVLHGHSSGYKGT